MKKFLPYILILLVLVSLFSPSNYALNAATAGLCKIPGGTDVPGLTQAQCESEAKKPENKDHGVQWWPDDGSTKIVIKYAASTEPIPGGTALNPADTRSALEKNLDASCDFSLSSTLPGCIEQIFYWLFFTIPSFLLYQAAHLFNFMIDLALNNQMISGSKFIGSAWAVVRDISNIFFILILLYVAVKMILDMGGHDTKKILARVVITALLINFSMFFAKVVIDSSNILALVFYNKLTVNTTESVNGAPPQDRPYTSVSGRETEKDLSGAMVANFDASKLLKEPFFEAIKKQIVVVTAFEPPGPGWILAGPAGVAVGNAIALKNYFFPQMVIPPATMISIILISGAIMLFAAWCFFVAAFAFLMRIIELWVLIIFSPFAFMSFSIPLLAHTEYIGWDAWSKRLLKVSFMAPIYMFFMYFIFKLIQEDIFQQMLPASGERGLPAEILTILLPAMFILILLKRATKFAQEAAGKIAEVGIAAAKIAGGLTLGAVTGGTALLATGTVGKFAAKVASDEGLKEATKKKGLSGWAARKAIQVGDYGSKASFDISQSKAGKSFAKSAGIDLQQAKVIGLGSQKDGYKGRAERRKHDLEEESKLYKTGKTNDEVKEWSAARLEQYEKDKEPLRQKPGFNEEEYDKEHKPKAYTGPNAAYELNHDRMVAFQDQLGLEGLLGAVAYSAFKRTSGFVDKENYKTSDTYVKQAEKQYKHEPEKLEKAKAEFDPAVANEVNKAGARTTKMAIGSAAAVAAGVATGGLGGMAIGGLSGGGLSATITAGMAGAGIGAPVGAVGALGYNLKETEGEAHFSEGLDKEHKKMDNIRSRVAAYTKDVKESTELLAKSIEDFTNGLKDSDALTTKDDDGNVMPLVRTNEKGEPEVITGNIERELASLKFTMEKGNMRLKTLVELEQKGEDVSTEMTSLRNEMISSTVREAAIKRLRDAPEKIVRAKKGLNDAGKDEDQIKGGGKKEKHEDAKPSGASTGGSSKPSGGTTPSAPAAPSTH